MQQRGIQHAAAMGTCARRGLLVWMVTKAMSHVMHDNGVDGGRVLPEVRQVAEAVANGMQLW